MKDSCGIFLRCLKNMPSEKPENENDKEGNRERKN